MARKNNRRKKVEPAVLTMFLTTNPISGGSSTSYIDLSQIASLMNRRFYRQGIQWAVSGFKFLSNNTGNVTISKLPSTWIMSNAWEKGFRAWQKMNNEALAESESVKPKFLDFKIYADADHHAAGFGANLLPGNLTSLVTPGEWESSKVVVPTSGGITVSSFEMVGTGPSFTGAGASGLNAVSLIEGYANSRGLPNIVDPNTPADADDVGPTATPENWLSAMFNEGTGQDKEVLDDMITENNIAPYPFENDGVHVDTMYPGGANQVPGLELHDAEYVTTTTVGGTTRMKGGLFPCGLIRIDVTNADEGVTYGVQIDLVPGDHRGYLCEPMTEM